MCCVAVRACVTIAHAILFYHKGDTIHTQREDIGMSAVEAAEYGEFAIRANRSGGSVLGAASARVKRDGEVVVFYTRAEAEAEADRMNGATQSFNVWYVVEEVAE